MSDNICPCGKPSPHATICEACQTTLRNDLTNIRDHWGDLIDAMGKQMRFGGNGGKVIGKTQPLPISPSATEAYWCANNTLTTWARHVHDAWPALVLPSGDGDVCATWLHDMAQWFVKDAWVIELADEVADTWKLIRRTIDRPADHQPLGQCGHVHEDERNHDGGTCACACHFGAMGAIPCNIPEGCSPGETTIAAVMCTEQLKAPRDATDVRCPTCGTTHDVESLRAATLLAHRDIVLPMPQLLDLLGIFTQDDRKATAAKVRQWVKRGHVTDRMVEVGTALRAGYRVGEVLDRLTMEARVTA